MLAPLGSYDLTVFHDFQDPKWISLGDLYCKMVKKACIIRALLVIYYRLLLMTILYAN